MSTQRMGPVVVSLALLSLAGCACRAPCCPCDDLPVATPVEMPVVKPAGATAPALAAPSATPPRASSPREADVVGTWIADPAGVSDAVIDRLLEQVHASLGALPPAERAAVEAALPTRDAFGASLRRSVSEGGLTLDLRPGGAFTQFARSGPPMTPRVGTWEARDGRLHVATRAMDGSSVDGATDAEEYFEWKDGRIGVPEPTSGLVTWFKKAPSDGPTIDVPAFPSDLVGTWIIDGPASVDRLVGPSQMEMRKPLAKLPREARTIAERLLPEPQKIREALGRRFGAAFGVTLALKPTGATTIDARTPTGTTSASGRWEARGGSVWVVLRVVDGKPAAGSDLRPRAFGVEGLHLHMTLGEGAPVFRLRKSTGVAESAPAPVVPRPPLPPPSFAPAPPIVGDGDLAAEWEIDLDRTTESVSSAMEAGQRRSVEALPAGQRELVEELLPAPERVREVVREWLAGRATSLLLEPSGAATVRTTDAGTVTTLVGTWSRKDDRVLVTWTSKDGEPVAGPLAGLHGYEIREGELTFQEKGDLARTWLKKR